jgi:DNA-binding CsgD family transcriptional regulator
MSPENSVLRPSDRELVRATSVRLRRSNRIPVVFAGLRDRDVIRVTESVGHHTAALRTITVTPERGLGGLIWLNKRARLVRDYGSAGEITHDFDDQILGEGITDLAAAPIVVDGSVRGLLYAGWRGGGDHLGDNAVSALSLEAGRIATELRIRDEVDRRVAAITARDQVQMPVPEWIHELRDIAAGSDNETRGRILHLIDEMTGGDRGITEPSIPLTPRQLQVLSLVAMGFGNRVVADRLGLTVDTVKTYLRAAMIRLGARTRHEAVVKARGAGHNLELC